MPEQSKESGCASAISVFVTVALVAFFAFMLIDAIFQRLESLEDHLHLRWNLKDHTHTPIVEPVELGPPTTQPEIP